MSATSDLPTGVVTLLFTDIEGSTSLWEKLRDDFYPILEQHNAILRAAIAQNHGHEVKTEGDAFVVAFANAADGVRCTIDAQLALGGAAWPASVGAIRVRMGLHTGEPIVATHPDGKRDYFGPTITRGNRIASAGHGGQVIVSAETQSAAGAMPNGATLVDLGGHQLKGLDQIEHLFQLAHDGFAIKQFPPLRTLNAVRHNLPVPTTSFVGRAKEIAELCALIADPQSRLMTVLGPGGTGKSRLSQHVAAEMAQRYADGVWLVELEQVLTANDVPPAILRALSVHPHPSRDAKDQLMEFLAHKSILLVLDNTEQIPDMSTIVAELLRASDGVECLVATRSVLRIRGEKVFQVPPLPLPSEEAEFAEIAANDSVALFSERAKDASGEFGLSPDNAAVIANIVRKVEGMPLAIELAAAQARVMPVTEILDRLRERFDSLGQQAPKAGGSSRQQTIRNAIDWSFELLSPAERTIFTLLSVFAGGFFVEAAVSVCAAVLQIDEFELESLVEEMRDKSLLASRETFGAMRYAMLETVREYSGEKLAAQEAEVVGAVRLAHASFFLTLAQKLDETLYTDEQSARTMGVELANLRASTDWAMSTGPDDLAANLVLSTCQFLRRSGYWSEGIERATAGIERAKRAFGENSLIVGRLMHLLAVPYHERGDFEQAKRWYNDALAIFRAAPDRKREGVIINNLALIAKRQGDLALAESLGLESYQVALEQNDDRGAALALNNLGLLAMQRGQFDHSQDYHEKSLALRQKIHDRQGVAMSLNNLGVVARRRGNLEQAAHWYRESLTHLKALGDNKNAAGCLHNLASIDKSRGDLTEATKLATESLDLRRKLGEKAGMAESLSLLSNLAFGQSKVNEAKQLAEQALALSEEIGDVPGVVRSLCNLGELCVKSADFPRAGELYTRASELAQKAADHYHIACAQAGRARCLAHAGDDRAAAILFRKARRTFLRQRCAPDFAEVMTDLAALHARLGQSPRATLHAAAFGAESISPQWQSFRAESPRHAARVERVMSSFKA